MGSKIYFGLLFVLGIMLTLHSGTTMASQLVTDPSNSIPYGFEAASQLADDMASRSELSLNHPDRMTTLASKHPVKDETPILIHDWGTEVIFSEKNAKSSNTKIRSKEEAEASEPPSLPNALWLFGLGILAILSIRRTSDYSNVT